MPEPETGIAMDIADVVYKHTPLASYLSLVNPHEERDFCSYFAASIEPLIASWFGKNTEADDAARAFWARWCSLYNIDSLRSKMNIRHLANLLRSWANNQDSKWIFAYARAVGVGSGELAPTCPDGLTSRVKALKNDLKLAETAKAHAVSQAKTWKQEAKTQKATVEECYSLVGADHEGDWNGADPIREKLKEMQRLIDEAQGMLCSVRDEGHVGDANDLDTLILDIDHTRLVHVSIYNEKGKDA